MSDEANKTGLTIIEAIIWLRAHPDKAVFSSTNTAKFLGFAHWNGNNLVDTFNFRSFEFDDLDITDPTWCTSDHRTYKEYYDSIDSPIMSLGDFINIVKGVRDE
jgi:hypothetical protein